MSPRKKRYVTARHPVTGKRTLLHRQRAEELIGRPLLPGEIVHHIDGDSTNNEPDNLLVLPSQAYHAHIEWVLRREKAGQPMLFPELHDEVRATRKGTLFEFVVVRGSNGNQSHLHKRVAPPVTISEDSFIIPPDFMLPGMTYKRLSEQVQELVNPQRSDTFIKRFREAVRTGEVKAINLPGERFTMPKQYSRRGKTGTYQKDTKEMLFEVTPEFEAWFEEQNKDLAVSRQGGQVKVTEETLAAGLVDFEALARETQEKMQASFEKGQQLGKSRSGKKTAAKPAARGRKKA